VDTMPENYSAEIIYLFRSKPNSQVAEGLRLIRAFMQIESQLERDAVIAFAEQLANSRSATGDPRSL